MILVGYSLNQINAGITVFGFLILGIGLIIFLFTKEYLPKSETKVKDLNIKYKDEDNEEISITTGVPELVTIYFGFIMFVCVYIIITVQDIILKDHENSDDDEEEKWDSNNALQRIKRDIEEPINILYPSIVASQNNVKTVDDEHEIRAKIAAEWIKETNNGYDLFSKIHLKSKNHYDTFTEFIFNMYNSWIWNIIIHGVIIVHICLSFVESRQARTKEVTILGNEKFFIGINPDYKVTIPECICLVMEMIDVVIRFIYISNIYNHILTAHYERSYIVLYFCVIVYLITDLVINYVTNKSIEYIVPVRPLLLIFMNVEFAKSFFNILGSIWNVLPILRVYFMVLLFFSISAQILYGDFEYNKYLLKIETNKEEIDKEYIEEYIEDMNNYWFILRSFITIFIFICSGENYTDVVYPGIRKHGLWNLFFVIPMLIFGVFIVTALFTSYFEDAFGDKEEIRRKKLIWKKRSGIVAAFLLMDRNKNNSLSLQNMYSILYHLKDKNNINTEKTQYLLSKLDKDNTKTIDLYEFVIGIEEIMINSEYNNTNEINQIELIFTSELFNRLRTIYIGVTLGILCFINIMDDKTIDLLLNICLMVNFVDIITTIIIVNPLKYFMYAQYNSNKIVDEFIYRFEFIIVLISMVLSVYAWIKFGFYYGKYNYMRIFPMISLLRIFSLWKTSKNILFMIYIGVKSTVPLFVVVFYYFFLFGVIGVTLYKDLNWDDGYFKDDTGRANYHNLSNAFICLIQGFLGEAFHELMFAIRDKKESWVHCWYIASYVFIMSLLFQNLFFGILLNIFSALNNHVSNGFNLHNVYLTELLMENDDITQQPQSSSQLKPPTPHQRNSNSVTNFTAGNHPFNSPIYTTQQRLNF